MDHFGNVDRLMELFAQDDEVAALDTRLTVLEGSARLAVLVPLAWHTRQRDCPRALALADEAETLLPAARIDDAERQRALARLRLVRAEIKTLFAKFDRAERLAVSAIAQFERLGDPIGMGDGHWLIASIRHDSGDRAQVDASLDQALQAYRAAGDLTRVEATLARGFAHTAFADPAQSATGLAQYFPQTVPRPEAVASWVTTARANVAGLTDNPGAAIKYDLQSYLAGRTTGQIRLAIGAAVNAADGFATLGDLDAALEWSERALSMARATGWPAMIGSSLYQTGEVLRLLGRHDEARAYLRDAYEVIAKPFAGSRNHVVVLSALGQLTLDVREYDEALDWFRQLEAACGKHGDPDLMVKLRRGQAKALSGLGQPEEAWRHATEALDRAREIGNAEELIQTLRVCAELHRQHKLPPPEGMTQSSAALYYLEQALGIATAITGYAVPAELLSQVAGAHAAAGDYRKAYQRVVAALAARNRKGGDEAERRALAMQIRLDIDRARADAEHHRKLALYDSLTELPNRRLLMDRLRQALMKSDRTGSRGALLFVDLDNFKRLNDTRGHDVGDLLLQQVGQRLSDCLRESDTVARFGGDEFVILLEGLSEQKFEAATSVEAIADKILVSLNRPYLFGTFEHHSTPSIGICLFEGQTETADELLKRADIAMYRAKAAGRNAVRFFDPAGAQEAVG